MEQFAREPRSGSSRFDLPDVFEPVLAGCREYGTDLWHGWGISVLLGMGGQLSFASISFMGIGGYAVANFCTGRLPFTLPPLAALFASLVVCGIFAWVLGLILFKLKGTYFTFATIALVQVAFT